MGKIVKFVGGAVVLIVVLAILGRPDPPAIARPSAKAEPVPATTPNPRPNLKPEPALPVKLVEAIARFRPLMTDTQETTSEGTADLAFWSAHYLKWAELAVRTNETTPQRVRKDVDAERGKRMCTPRGRIIEIAKQDTGDGPSVFAGLLLADGELVHFYAVKSTGSLVENDSARLCGVVTGRYDYRNSGGGSGHAIELVGMFDLPENTGSAKK